MLLLNVKNHKGKTFIEVQNGDTAYRSRALKGEEVTFYCREVVMGILASAGLPIPMLNIRIPEATELKKPLQDGIGLTDDHKKLIVLKGGEQTVIEEGVRWLVARALMLRVGHAVNKGNHVKGEW